MNDRKETIILFMFVVVFIAAVFFLCAGRSTVHDLRIRTEPVRAELENARQKQQEQSETLEKAERATGTGRERIADSKRFNKKIADTEWENAEIIAECQSILVKVRARGSKEDPN